MHQVPMEVMVGGQPIPAPESPQTPLAAANRVLSKLLSSAATPQIALVPLHERRGAYEVARRCVEDAACSGDAPTKAVLYFRSDRYEALQETLGIKGEPGLLSPAPQRSLSPVLRQHHSDPHSTDSPGSVDSRSSQNKIAALWKTTVKSINKTATSINKTATSLGSMSLNSMSLGPVLGSAGSGSRAADKAEKAAVGPPKASPGGVSLLSEGGESETDDGGQLQPGRALEVLAAAAPVSCEARHWAWMLHWVSQGCSSAPAAALRMRYLASTAQHLGPDLDCLRLLLEELQRADESASRASAGGGQGGTRSGGGGGGRAGGDGCNGPGGGATSSLSFTRARSSDSYSCRSDSGRLSAAPLSGIIECQEDVQAVATRAAHLAHAAVLDYRTNYTTEAANADMLALAVRLLHTAASLAPGSAGPAAAAAETDESLGDVMRRAAERRYASLRDRLLCCSSSATAGPAGARGRATAGALISLVHQLVDDVQDDVEHYHAAFPAASNLCLAAISCRAYCEHLSRDLGPALASGCVPIDGTLVELVAAVHKMELLAVKWCPAGRGPAPLTDASGSPLFLGHVERWFRAARERLLDLGERLQEQELWSELGSGNGSRRSNQQSPRCTRSLQEFCRALYGVVEEGLPVMTSHPQYAALMERTLSRAVLTYAAGLERRALEALPGSRLRRQLQAREQQQCEGGGGGGGGEHLTAMAADTPCFSGRPDAATVSLCHCLNDLREIRARLSEMAAALKRRLQSDWWGRSASGSRSDSGRGLGSSSGTSLLQEGRVKANIGDRFRLCQGEIERRYAGVLHRYVRSVSGPLAACISDVIAAAGPDDEGSSPSGGAGRGGGGLGGGGDGASPGAVPAEVSFRLQPAANHLDRLLEGLSLALDGRVLKRLTRELWNTAAGVLHDRALSDSDNAATAGAGGDGSPSSVNGSGGGTGGGNSYYKSIDTVGPRIRAADAALRWFAAYFTAGYGGCGGGGCLRRGDEPDKAKQLTRMLAFFLKEDATESFDGLVSH